MIENEFGDVGIDDSLLAKNMKEHTEDEVQDDAIALSHMCARKSNSIYTRAETRPITSASLDYIFAYLSLCGGIHTP